MRAVALQSYFTQLAGDPTNTDDDVGRHTPSVVTPVTGDEVRRVVVDSNKCLNCHEVLELHGGSRVNNVQVCVLCHNPNLSSSGRAVDATQTPQEQKDALAAAGYDPENSLTWPEATLQLKNLVHAVHGAGVRNYAYEFVRNRQNGIYYNFSEVTFPGILSNCETCHVPGVYDADLPEGVLVTTDVTTDGTNASRQAVQAARDSIPNPTDLIISPTVATCYACHDSDPAAAHFVQNGGVIDNWRSEALGE
jgi:OmcA/MtrC family decaheme c-type cytochrome